MKYATETDSDACIPSFIKIGSGIQKLMRGIHRQHADHVTIFLFFQNKESKLKACRILAYTETFGKK
jgi:hypothetical protein